MFEDYVVTFLVGWLVIVPVGLIALMLAVDYWKNNHKTS